MRLTVWTLPQPARDPSNAFPRLSVLFLEKVCKQLSSGPGEAWPCPQEGSQGPELELEASQLQLLPSGISQEARGGGELNSEQRLTDPCGQKALKINSSTKETSFLGKNELSSAGSLIIPFVPGSLNRAVFGRSNSLECRAQDVEPLRQKRWDVRSPSLK